MLHEFERRLRSGGRRHRIVSDDHGRRQWSTGDSPARIEFIAEARHRALEPLQSPDLATRLPDYHTFTKIIFLNDTIYRHEDILELVVSPGAGDFDQVCAMDYGRHGEPCASAFTRPLLLPSS